LFSLINPFNISFKANTIKPENAIYSFPDYGPFFGDLCIYDQSYKSNKSYFNIGENYALPSYALQNESSIFNFSFQTAEIEVYAFNRNIMIKLFS
jgi:hypothetical protein